MIQICSEEKCTGCCACVDKCPFSAITTKLNSEGFIIPIIDQSLCTDCKSCLAVCPAINDDKFYKTYDMNAFRCWSKNDADRIDSASGGLFTVLAKYIIENGGEVIGAAFNDKLELKHTNAKTFDELEPLRGSKYIGSNLEGMYKKTKELLEEDKLVLFSGTPCQNEGLLRFLDKEYENLYTCDFICHGVGSTGVFNDYVNHLSKVFNAKPQSVSFRKKIYDYLRPTFEVKFNSGNYFRKFNYATFFGYFFMNSTSNRLSCSDCKFASVQRVSDFTLADYGCEDINKLPKLQMQKGISLVILNTKKAEKLFDIISDRIVYSKCSEEKVLSASNAQRLKEICYSSIWRDEFFKDYQNMNFDLFYKKWSSKIPSNYEKQIKYSGKITGNPLQFIFRVKNRLSIYFKIQK